MTHVTVVLKTNEGGIWVLPQLEELKRRGADITVVIPEGDGKLRRSLDAAGHLVVPSPFDFTFRPSVRLVRGLWAMRRTLKATLPDVIFYHLYASALACRLTSLGLRARRVHMVAGPLYLENPRIRAVERVLCHLDDYIIAGSEYTAQRYRALGVSPRRLAAIPYGVDVAKFSAGLDERQELLGVSPSTFVAAMVAYVYAPKSSVFPGVGIKGHDLLLEAWQQFTTAHPDSLLVLVGSGFDEEGERHRQRLIERYGVVENQTIQWYDSVEDVRPIYNSADVSVSPSLSENHGAVLEASAMGVPSIVSDAGALPETVRAGSGWIVPAGDAVGLLGALESAHEEFRSHTLDQRGAAARALAVQKFSHDLVVPLVAEAVLGSAGRGGTLLALCEQRAWRDGEGHLHGLKTLSIVQSLAEQVEVRLAVRVGPMSDRRGRPLADGTTIVPLPWPKGLSSLPGSAITVARTLWREVGRADVVYADVPGIVAGLGTLFAAARRTPLVVNVVGDAYESVAPAVLGGVRGRLAHAIFPTLQRWACRRAVLANYVTQSVLQKRYPAPLASRTFAASTAAALGPGRPPREFPQAKGGSLVTVATLDQNYKGIGDLLQSLTHPRLQELGISLTVIGSGRLRGQYVTQAAKLGISVRFVDHLSPAELYTELGRHDAFVLASWTEGLPRALMEAMADGMPAVATRVGGVPDLLEPTRVVSPHSPNELAHAIADLFEDQLLWERSAVRNQAVATAQMREGHKTLRGFVTAITELVDTRGSIYARR